MLSFKFTIKIHVLYTVVHTTHYLLICYKNSIDSWILLLFIIITKIEFYMYNILTFATTTCCCKAIGEILVFCKEYTCDKRVSKYTEIKP